MADIQFPVVLTLPVGKQQINLKFVDNGDGSYSPEVALGSAGIDIGTVKIDQTQNGVVVNSAAVPAPTTMQNAVTGNANGTPLATAGYAVAMIQVTGTSGGVTVVNFEATVDGSTWFAISAIQNGALVSSTVIDGDFKFYVAAHAQVRARISNYSAGTITVLGYLSVASPYSHQTGLLAAENHVGSVGGQHIVAVDSFTRPNDTVGYSIGDALTNSTSSPVALHFANILRVAGGSGYAVKAVLACDNPAVATQLRLHLYDTAPTMPNDNTQWNPLYADIITTPIYRGYLDFPAFSELGVPANSGAGAQVESTTVLSIGAANASKDLYGVLQVIQAFNPLAQSKYGVRLSVDAN